MTIIQGMKNQVVEEEPKILAVATPSQTTDNSHLNQIVRPQEVVALVERTRIDLNSTPSIEDCTPINSSFSGSSLLGEVNVTHELTQIISNNNDVDVIVPFTKVSTLWEAVESMEVFKTFPQKPHFRALKQHELELRDGMAIGLMIAFANIVDSIKKIKITDNKYIFEEKFKALLSLELNGFNVEPLRLRLEKLLELQNIVDQSKEEKKQIEELLAEKDKEKEQLDILIEDNDKTIMDLVENLSSSLKRRELLTVEMIEKDYERAQLKTELQATKEALAAEEFNACSDAGR